MPIFSSSRLILILFTTVSTDKDAKVEEVINNKHIKEKYSLHINTTITKLLLSYASFHEL
jgi:hypothetical protein